MEETDLDPHLPEHIGLDIGLTPTSGYLFWPVLGRYIDFA
jgi:hypothetical protein